MKILFLPLFMMLIAPLKAQTTPQSPRDSKELLPAVAQAIEDELYDLRHEKLYFQIDENSGGDSSPAEISMYVSKAISSNGTGIVVYKDMPYGEVYRYFDVQGDGTVKLFGRADLKVSPSWRQYVDGLHDERGSVRLHPAKGLQVQIHYQSTGDSQANPYAEARQLSRTGYSFRLGKGPGHK